MVRSNRLGVFTFLIAVLAAHLVAPAADLPAATTTPATQPEVPATSPSSTPATKPAAKFQLAEAATQAESASITLRSVTTEQDSDRQVAQIADDLPILTTEIDSRLDESSKLLSSSPSLQLLGMQEEDWSAIQHNLDEWELLLKQRLARIAGAKKEVDQLTADWTQEQALLNFVKAQSKHASLLEAAQKSIKDTLAIIKSTADELQNRRGETYALEQAVDTQSARVAEVLESIRQARDEAFDRLLTKDSPSLWSFSELSKDNHRLMQQGQQSFGRQVEAVVAYIKRRRGNVGAHIVLLMALIAALYWIRAHTRRWAKKEPDLEQATCVFASPIATGVVLSLLLSAKIYPQAPRLLWAMLGAAALIPTVIILRKLIDRRWFSVLNTLVVFYFIDQLRTVAAVLPIMSRLLFLMEMLGGIAVLASFILGARKRPATGRVAKLARAVSWLWLGAFAFAFLGDVLGYVSISSLLGDAALKSAYVAVVLYACTRIVSGLLLIALRSRPLVDLPMVRRHQRLITHRLNIMLDWIASIAWALGVLGALSIAAPAFDISKRVLAAQFVYGDIHLSLGDVLTFALTIWVSVQLSRFLRFVLEEDIYARFALPGGIPYAISKMLNYVILLIGFFIAVSALGYDLTKFTILAGAFGVGLGFGMQNIVNNFVSGLILLFERPVKVGDVIQMDDATGVVNHIGIRASIIRTNDSAEIIVPNGNLISGKVTNWTLSNRQRGISIKLSVAATADPKHVIELLTKIAAAHPLVTNIPPPQAVLTTFSADAFSYDLTAWTNNADQWIQIRSELAVAIHAALTKENIAIR